MTDALWYLGRGSGMVALALLTVVIVLGVATRSGRAVAGLPRFAVASVHRNASLLAVLFLGVHVATMVADPYAQLDVLATVVPFTARAEPFFYGLGALALDLIGALVVTSLLSNRVGPRVWRYLHLLAYAAWPVALVHAVGSGTDAARPWMLATVGASLLAVATAVTWRLSDRFAERPDPLSRRRKAHR